MPKLPRVKPTKVIAALQRAGFYTDHVTGSHYILYKDDKSNPVSVPRHNKDIKFGTLDSQRVSRVLVNRCGAGSASKVP